ncbi:MAG: FtsX-like permease family protein [Planctomycetia bacterium]|nr:FtsX-like permease family protein [Planctomycetia bacterium]
MKFLFNLVVSRMSRQKTRLALILLAIAGASCLIVWTVGGYQSLFIEAVSQESDYMGVYDLRAVFLSTDSGAGARRGAGGGFSGPFTRNIKKENTESTPEKDSKKNGGKSSRGKNRSEVSRGKSFRPALTENLIAAIEKDSAVIQCDTMSPVRAFVYSQNANKSDSASFIDTYTDRSDVPVGIAPQLHRQGLAAYRKVMGTPMGMGVVFTATSAPEPVFELEDGRWLRQNSHAQEAVMTARGAEKYHVRPGDHLLIITKTKEFQFDVVGVLEGGESEFYIPNDMAELILDERPAVTELGLKLRVLAEEFRDRWQPVLAEQSPGLHMLTGKDLADRKKKELENESNLFRYQAVSGTLLAVLASIFIIFTTLNMNVSEQKRQIALYRMIGLTRGQVAISILIESLLLSVPGWLGGLLTGWLLLILSTGSSVVLNGAMLLFSFVCAVVGALFAAIYPMLKSMRVKPLDALDSSDENFLLPSRRSGHRFVIPLATFFGLLFIAADLYLVFALPVATETRAMLHSGLGMLLLVLGTLLLIPLLIQFVERAIAPLLAWFMRLNSPLVRSELSGNLGRTVAVAALLAVGGGLFVSMQIWGYSMLGPFLPGRGMPDCFAAFLPVGLDSEFVNELQDMPGVKSDEFLPVAVEQAAFAPGSVTSRADTQSPFANVVFLGADVDRAYAGPRPLVSMQFLQGDRSAAFDAMKTQRGVLITDSIAVDYGLNLGDRLKVKHPREESVVLEYPIVGVVSFSGWQWLSKTSGVRRNFGRSGGLVFANVTDILDDYQLDRFSYFWFNSDKSIAMAAMESSLDRLAQKNLAVMENREPYDKPASSGQSAYVKLSTRDSLYQSISQRADSVIWGLSKMPMITLMITSLAVMSAVSSSVRARRRQFGIMRAVGVTRFAIIRLILLEAILVGLVATLSSFLFGLLAAVGALKLGQSMFGTVDPPLILPVAGLVLGLCLTLTLCLAAALYPALATGTKSPLDLLRH